MHTIELNEDEMVALRDLLDAAKEVARDTIVEHMHAEIAGLKKGTPKEVADLAENFSALVDAFDSMVEKVGSA